MDSRNKAGDVEYNTSSDVKEERIANRWKRIQNRTQSENTERLNRGKEAEQEVLSSQGQQQIADSLSALDKKKSQGIDSVTNIRAAADDRETQRRIHEERVRQERLQLLQEEAVASGKQNAAVEMRWAELIDRKDHNMPQELHSQIQAQKQACSQIIASKDSLIHEFELQLKAKDEEYVKALKQQAEDIDEMLKRMRSEFKELQEEYESQLDAIEDAFMQERSDLLKANKEEIDSLFERRREMEMEYMRKKQERQEEAQKEIEDNLTKDAEEYNKLKIKLENDIQTLQEQLEEMRATYQLNTEKLEYNFRVLTERDNENKNTLTQQKRKQNRLKDALSALMARYHETDARDRRKNDELTEKYRLITKQYKDLQAKFRHFEVQDSTKYQKIWDMHEDEVRLKIDTVLQASQIVHIQQLGWEWQGPNLELLYNRDSLNASLVSVQEEKEQVEVDEEESDDNYALLVSGAKIRAMLELIIQEAGFLLDYKMTQALDSLPPEQAEVKQAEALFQALGVEDEKEIETLCSYFFRKNIEEDDEPPTGEDYNDLALEVEKVPDIVRQLKSLIGPEDVINAVQNFVDDRREARLMGQKNRGGNQLSLDDLGASGTLGAQANTKSNKARREKLQAETEKAYWDRLANVISPKETEVWKQLESSLINYNNVLKDRFKGIQDVEQLQANNTQLKGLLTQYLGSQVNQDLIVPPTETIRVATNEAPGGGMMDTF
eukprot:CAMPEP_0117860952 /NCGR_PEP_ID=MMETSP0950-20121206/4090_1 /TAXON_ID=44440 /ORGANISM="Chattonella subsalsa, Strain CCMP2191" /LENGTH=721 /DNA_ID=CAMNT_0005711225 /DNA_START=113 /DNA_END=2278 /DNA_ORIENTATION=-